MNYLNLFLVFFRIGAFTFGGGYAMLPLIEREIVSVNQWLSQSEFIDIFAISQMSPGPIAINAATFVGFRSSGVPGALFATFGVILPSFILVTSLAKMILNNKDSVYIKGIFAGIRPAVIGLISAACLSMFQISVVDYKGGIIAIVVFIIFIRVKVHPIILILFSGFLGVFLYS
ncbi:MAG: chromate transporter [Clostridiales bacterium]|nr:chromate transporter [Clostridiales bacterium]